MWCQWWTELHTLERRHIQRCYFHREVSIVSVLLHGFSDASEEVYAGVVYISGEDSDNNTHMALVAAKSKVAPIHCLTIPHSELCGAHLLAQLLFHVKEVFNIPLSDCYARTDSTIALNWLVGSSCHFKTKSAIRCHTLSSSSHQAGGEMSVEPIAVQIVACVDCIDQS